MTNDENLVSLVERYLAMPSADRKTILAQLPAGERQKLDQLLENAKRAREEEQNRSRNSDRQMAAYSRWLADLIQNVCDDDKPGIITARTSRALAAAHEELRESQPLPVGAAIIKSIKKFFAISPATEGR